MCNQDSLWKNNDEIKRDEQQTDWSEEEYGVEKAGELSSGL
jgi:hypothetical protein